MLQLLILSLFTQPYLSALLKDYVPDRAAVRRAAGLTDEEYDSIKMIHDSSKELFAKAFKKTQSQTDTADDSSDDDSGFDEDEEEMPRRRNHHNRRLRRHQSISF